MICLPDPKFKPNMTTIKVTNNPSVSARAGMEDDLNSGSEVSLNEASLVRLDDTFVFSKEACLEVLLSEKEVETCLVQEGLTLVEGQCHECKRMFAGSKGVKIHRTKSRTCGVVMESSKHRCLAKDVISEHGDPGSAEKSDRGGNSESIVVSLPDESVSSEPSTLNNNNTRYAIEEEIAALQGLAERPAIRWPLMKDGELWESLDSRVSCQLPVNMVWSDRLKLLQDIIYTEAAAMFGCVTPVSRVGKKRSRGERQLGKIRDDIRRCTARRKVAPQSELYGYDCVLDDLKERRRKVRSSVNARKRRSSRRKLKRSFLDNPFQAAKDMLSPKVPTQLKVPKAVLDEYVQKVASDPEREKELGEVPGFGLLDAVLPKVDLNKRPFTASQLDTTLKHKKSRSRPGPNQIPYKVYKKCSKLKGYLLDILNAALRAKSVPFCWRISDGIMIPKVDSPKSGDIGDFRQIALLNVEGKLFWSIVADRLYQYLVTNNSFVSPFVQKGSMRKVPGCWEHTAMVWSALKDARKSKSSVAVLWLDLANAYGSVPHKLIEFALKRYQVPDDWIDLILAYYDGLWGRTTASGISSDWARYERGIFAGCTISVILFVAAFNVLLEYVDNGGVARFKLSNGNSIELLRGFMDDVSIMTGSVAGAEVALKRTEEVVKWARMKLKPSKSRSLIVHKGRSMDIEPFYVGSEVIPALQRKKLRTLGRVYDSSISDRRCKGELKVKVAGGCKMLNKSHARGYMKLWALHHIFLPQVRWDLMIYEIPVSFVEKVGWTISKYIRRWLGISKNFTGVGLYSQNSPCPLPFQSLVDLFKTTKVNSHLQLVGSSHQEVVNNVKPSDTGKKWKLCEPKRILGKHGIDVDLGAVRRCMQRLEVEKMIGKANEGRTGLGFGVSQQRGDTKKKRAASKVREEIEEDHLNKAVSLTVQGKWTKWKDYHQRVYTWKSLFYSDMRLTRFCLGSTFDTLASPANLKRWGFSLSNDCYLCQKSGCTVSHVLSGCPVALGQGRYRYRHDSVLRVLCHHIGGFLNNLPSSESGRMREIQFVPEGSKVANKRKIHRRGLLFEATDWKLLADLGKRLVFPAHIHVTSLRPDIVIFSNAEKIIIMVELTCPSEENFQARHEDKLDKYDDLKTSCIASGWKCFLFAVEVGARGYVAQSLSSCMSALGLDSRSVRKCVNKTGDEALRTSFWVWYSRDDTQRLRLGFVDKQVKESRLASVNHLRQVGLTAGE